MEFKFDRTKHRKSLAFTAQVIRLATRFMPLSTSNEGYHELLQLDIDLLVIYIFAFERRISLMIILLSICLIITM